MQVIEIYHKNTFICYVEIPMEENEPVVSLIQLDGIADGIVAVKFIGMDYAMVIEPDTVTAINEYMFGLQGDDIIRRN